MIDRGPIQAIGAGALALAFTACQTRPPVRAIDVDTFDLGRGVILRLEGYDGPETRISDPINPNRGAQCPAEKAHGLQAKAAAQALIDTKRFKAQPSNPPRTDRYGRVLGQATVNGHDYAKIMMTAGHLRPYPYAQCGRDCKPDWCRTD